VESEYERIVYVERLGEAWRWSLAHQGGLYPLLRITARFLRVDYDRIAIGARAVDGWSVRNHRLAG
jgi:hypothetical protein